MRKALVFTTLLPALAIAGCGIGKEKSLDEFAVARNAPLVIPPDYSLTPPVAGTVSLSAENAQAQAIEALFGGPAPRSAGETSVLDAAVNGYSLNVAVTMTPRLPNDPVRSRGRS